jgi:hypothetical protein
MNTETPSERDAYHAGYEAGLQHSISAMQQARIYNTITAVLLVSIAAVIAIAKGWT